MSGDCDREMKAVMKHNDITSIMNAAPRPGEVFNDVRLYVLVTYMVYVSRACQICRPWYRWKSRSLNHRIIVTVVTVTYHLLKSLVRSVLRLYLFKILFQN